MHTLSFVPVCWILLVIYILKIDMFSFPRPISENMEQFFVERTTAKTDAARWYFDFETCVVIVNGRMTVIFTSQLQYSCVQQIIAAWQVWGDKNDICWTSLATCFTSSSNDFNNSGKTRLSKHITTTVMCKNKHMLYFHLVVSDILRHTAQRCHRLLTA